MTPDSLNTFPTRIPVEAGDVIGFFVAALGSCGSDPTVVGFGYHYKFLDAAGRGKTCNRAKGARI
jgi:hypothetical protein